MAHVHRASGAAQIVDQRAAQRNKAGSRITLVGALTNVLLSAAKGIAGVLAASPVMVADAVHSLSDLVTDVVALLSLRLASAPADEDHPYGHGRFETLGTVAVATLLIAVAGGIAVDAFGRFSDATEPGVLAVWAALGSIVVKEALYQATARVGHKYDSPVLIANAWHHRSDALSSVAALAGILGARMGFPILDPIAAILVAVMIGHMAVGLLSDAVREVTDSAPEQDELAELGAGVARLPGVVHIHELRSRRMGPRLLVDLHVEVVGSTTVSDGHQVAERVRKYIHEQDPSVSEVLVHIDPEPDDTPDGPPPLFPPRDELVAVVQEQAAEVSGIEAVTHVQVHFLGGKVAVQVNVEMGQSLSIGEAGVVARRLRERIERLEQIDHADIHLELDDRAHGELPRELADLGHGRA